MNRVTDSTPPIVGSSAKTQQILRNIKKIAEGRWPVLILGETGTGKEVVARNVYGSSPVGPFVTIDCSSLVGPLLESELFGHMRGAFTGAVGAKVGLIESANGGTAFFDEIGELPLDLQAKLLRVLQQKEFRPVGSHTSRRSDFRIIAATNRDLAREVARGNFRSDLYYRLNVVTLKLSPLRDRREDIPALVQYFVDRLGHGHRLTAEVMDAFYEYEWPGNVRELENCIQQMVAINSGPLLHLADMPTTVQNFTASRRGQAMAAGAGAQPVVTPSHSSEPAVKRIQPQAEEILPLNEIERRHIQSVLHHVRGDRSRAAYLLGIGRTTLYRKIKEYELAG
jgi:DNA-binding NtrC family response regulator